MSSKELSDNSDMPVRRMGQSSQKQLRKSTIVRDFLANILHSVWCCHWYIVSPNFPFFLSKLWTFLANHIWLITTLS